MGMFVVEPNVVRRVSRCSPPSLHSLAFVASSALPTSELEVLPPTKFKQIKAFKEAPGRYSLVKQSISYERGGDHDENGFGRSGFYGASINEFYNFLLYHRDDSVIEVAHMENLNVWKIGRDCGVWHFEINGDASQVDIDEWIKENSSSFEAEVDKNGNIKTEFILRQSEQSYPNPVQFNIQIKISLEENKMDINVKGENEHFVGEFSGQYAKLD